MSRLLHSATTTPLRPPPMLHYRVAEGVSACGKRLPYGRLSGIASLVGCRSCHRVLARLDREGVTR